ncbi:hypothetical protein [Natronosalvus vescus]|uniref:hypothetical protein n=1 Tax=Natronosalvus vescus TaxID=2953881 RepID=UPI00209103B1|nr:hypothetical protein [Natronosalvus vescus]
MTPPSNGDETDDLTTHVDAIYRHLEATAELPIDHRTNRWLGEAEAVARDAAENDLDEATIRKRIRQVEHLLAEADETGHDDADEHLAAARERCRDVLEDAE